MWYYWVGSYIIFSILIYIHGVMHDYAIYRKNPHVHYKFPLNKWSTHKIMIGIAFAWLPLLLIITYGEIKDRMK